MPLVPPWTSTQSPSAAKPRSNRLTQTVKRVSGIAAASTSDKRFGNQQAGAGRRHAIFGIAAARDERADQLAHEVLRAFARFDDPPAISSPRMSGAPGGGG